MSIFVSPQDFITMSNDCEKVSYTICGHTYQLWCKKDKVETANYIFDKISAIIEKNNSKNTGFSFDKILFMSLIDILAKDKATNDNKTELQNEKKQANTINNYTEITNEIVDILDIIKQQI